VLPSARQGEVLLPLISDARRAARCLARGVYARRTRAPAVRRSSRPLRRRPADHRDVGGGAIRIKTSNGPRSVTTGESLSLPRSRVRTFVRSIGRPISSGPLCLPFRSTFAQARDPRAPAVVIGRPKCRDAKCRGYEAVNHSPASSAEHRRNAARAASGRLRAAATRTRAASPSTRKCGKGRCIR